MMQVEGREHGVLGRTYEAENCSAARALEVVGERWSLLIIRDALFRGRTRFSEFQHSLGIAPNILATRLDRFVDEGLMELRRTSEHGAQFDYVVTAKGQDLKPVIMALTAWGDRWDAPVGAPVVFTHDGCDGPVGLELHCGDCHSTVQLRDVDAIPGPGSRVVSPR
jgi:DNA-binding HxlR family transcriptional regulator